MKHIHPPGEPVLGNIALGDSVIIRKRIMATLSRERPTAIQSPGSSAKIECISRDIEPGCAERARGILISYTRDWSAASRPLELS